MKTKKKLLKIYWKFHLFFLRYSWVINTGAFSGYLTDVTLNPTGDDSLAICDFYINYENMQNADEAFWLDSPCQTESNSLCGYETYQTQLIVCKLQ